MKHIDYRRALTSLLIVILTTAITDILSSCGTMRSYWGVENEYNWNPDHHHHKKPKKKHKKHKHHKHHHDD